MSTAKQEIFLEKKQKVIDFLKDRPGNFLHHRTQQNWKDQFIIWVENDTLFIQLHGWSGTAYLTPPGTNLAEEIYDQIIKEHLSATSS